MNCSYCQHALRESARFCDLCGTPIPPGHVPTEATDARSSVRTLPVTDPLVGRVLDSKYEIIERLGEGGMGAVYRGLHKFLRNQVAIKVLHAQYVTNEEMLKRFRQEARAAASINHPHVVTIHDFGEARGDEAPAYIVMELLKGPPLRELLHKDNVLHPERAISLMRDICAGVGAAHQRNIVHRDIKPDNIIILPRGYYYKRETVKVVDFGIAKLRDIAAGNTLTQPGMVLGTPFYMSPEQCRAEKLDARSDVYSLGVVMYEMLAGRPPFVAPSFAGVIAKHLTEPPPPLPHHLGIPPALEAAIMRSLAKSPNSRQADASALARDLRVFEDVGNKVTVVILPKKTKLPGSRKKREVIRVKVGDKRFDAKSIPELYKQLLVFLHESDCLKGLPLPITTGSKRYLIAREPRHQGGNHFVMDVEYKGYHMEAHMNRKAALFHLDRLLGMCGLSLKQVTDEAGAPGTNLRQ